MGASVIAGGNASPVFEFSEHALNFVTLSVEYLAVRMLGIAGFSGWNAGGCTACDQGGTKFIAVIAFVADQHGRRW